MAHMRALVGVVKTFKNWPTHVLDYMKLISPRILIYRLRNGVNFKARAKTLDNMVIREVWMYSEYNPTGFEIAADAIVVDVGGHIGCFAVLAGRMASKGKVYVFEPTPENFKLLLENLQLNASSNVTALNLALLGHSGTRQMALCSNKVSNSIFVDWPNSPQIDVQGISMYEFMKQNNLARIDFMKLDCEGAEYEILFECPDATLACIQKISAEVHGLDDQRNRAKLAQFLESKGFHVTFGRTEGSPMLYAKR